MIVRGVTIIRVTFVIEALIIGPPVLWLRIMRHVRHSHQRS